MGLLHPTPGEILDRLAILKLKIEAGTHAGLNLVWWRAEENELKEELRFLEQNLEQEFPAEKIRIRIQHVKTGILAVNSLLWQEENLVRQLADTEITMLAKLAKQIARLNDERRKLIGEATQLYGHEVIEAKIYQ